MGLEAKVAGSGLRAKAGRTLRFRYSEGGRKGLLRDTVADDKEGNICVLVGTVGRIGVCFKYDNRGKEVGFVLSNDRNNRL